MPVGFHHHRGSEKKDGANTATADRSSFHYNPAGHAVVARHTSGATAQSSPSRSSGVSADQLQRFDVLLRRPENRECFDCGAKQPRWASTNLGIFFCLRCAGIHRSMGTHISKVKSTNMDAWEESMIQIMEHIGNARGRLLYEYNMPASARVTSSTEVSLLERALRAKYEKKTYYHPNFAELYEQFMVTPIEGVSNSSAGAQQSNDNNSGISPSLLRSNPSSCQTSSQPPLDELWGPPVSSPTAAESGQENVSGSRHNAAAASVAELFSGSRPAGVGAGPRISTASGSGQNPGYNNSNNNNIGHARNGMTSSVPSPSSATNSDWFDSNFGGSNGNPGASGAPSPTSLHSPPNAVTSRSNADDLFQGSGSTPLNGPSGGPKAEILSLFASAPLAGTGWQPGGVYSSQNGTHPMAWQPQTVKPYYFP